MRTTLFLASMVFWLSLPFSATAAQEQLPLAIKGYSVISYFTEDQPQLGSEEFSEEYDGKRYLFTNEKQRSLFQSDPGHFTPRYENCPYSLTLGMTLPLDPTNFKVVGGYLLLFHRSDTMDGQLKWQESKLSDEDLLQRADKAYTLVTF